MSILVRHGKQYCVYTHGIDGVVFWVGHGSPVRAFEHHGGRNKDWQKEVTQDYVVDIVSWHDSRKEDPKFGTGVQLPRTYEEQQEGRKAMRLAPRKEGNDQFCIPCAKQGKLSLSPRKEGV